MESEDHTDRQIALCLNIRQQNGKVYSQNSLLNCRVAAHHHLQTIDFQLNIFRGPEFARSNEALGGQLEQNTQKQQSRVWSLNQWQQRRNARKQRRVR